MRRAAARAGGRRRDARGVDRRARSTARARSVRRSTRRERAIARRADRDARTSRLTRRTTSRAGYRTCAIDARVDASDEAKRQRATARAALDAARDAARRDEGRDGATRTLARCTIAFAEPEELRRAMLALGDDLARFDVLALEPTSERAFASACANKHADVVSVGAGARARYKLAASAVRAATGNRISFELCYGEALRDSNSRMWFFANASALARATRGGRELFILSSGAERAIELRSMYDVVNLATFFGMTEKAARAAMTTNVHAMLAMCKRRRDAAATDSVVERMDASA